MNNVRQLVDSCYGDNNLVLLHLEWSKTMPKLGKVYVLSEIVDLINFWISITFPI